MGNNCNPLGLDNRQLFPASVFISRSAGSLTPNHFARLNSNGFECDYYGCYVGIELGKR